jgi:Cu-processing system permease protein
VNSRIFHIATNTFREAVRDRVLYNLIAFALLMSAAAVLVGQISIEIERVVVVNLGLTAVSLFGIVIAIFIGIGLKGNRQAHAVHGPFAPSQALGIHRR